MTSTPDQIREDIERTQQNLSANVDELAEKVSPPRMVERQVQRTRSAMTDMKDKIMGSTTEQVSAIGETATSTAASAKDTLTEKASSAANMVGSAPEQARRRTKGNPIAAGVIAFGVGWLVSSLLPATEPEQQMASQVWDLAVDKGGPVAGQLREAGQESAQELRESAMRHAQAVKESASQATSAVTDQAQSEASAVTDHVQQARSTVTDQAGPGA